MFRQEREGGSDSFRFIQRVYRLVYGQFIGLLGKFTDEYYRYADL